MKIEKDELQAYQAKWNASSLDGLTGLRAARRRAGERLWLTEGKSRVRRAMASREVLVMGILIGMFLVIVVQYLQGAVERQNFSW